MWNPIGDTLRSASVGATFPHRVLGADALFFSPENTIIGVSFPSWFPVQHLPIHPTYAAREGLGTYFSYRVANSGMSAAMFGML